MIAVFVIKQGKPSEGNCVNVKYYGSAIQAVALLCLIKPQAVHLFWVRQKAELKLIAIMEMQARKRK